MAMCCKCKKHFKVMEDENPEDFGCPYCGFRTHGPAIRCNMCMLLFDSEDNLEEFEDDDGPFLGCPNCETEEYLMDLGC